MYLKFYFGPISKVCYRSTSGHHPSDGTKTPYAEAATITNFQLMLAVHK